MMTPQDAKRLVKNRNARDDRARAAMERAEDEQLDFLEEAIAFYFSDSDFSDYLADEIDVAIEEGINTHLPVHVAFYFYASNNRIQDDISEEADYDIGSWQTEAVRLVAFDPMASGIEADPKELAEMFMQTVRAFYRDAGWETSAAPDYDNWHTYKLYDTSGSPHAYRGSIQAYSFELYY